MNAARKKVQELALEYITKITQSNENALLYQKEIFDKMTDEQFEQFMVDLERGDITLSIIVPNDGMSKITVENNLKIGEDIGYEFFQHVRVGANGDIPEYITPNKVLVYMLPIRRAAQLLAKKMSVPEDNHSIDLLSGQVTGTSKSSKLTMPEIQILIGMGCKDTIIELMKTRGGDEGEANALTNILYNEGAVSQERLREYSTGVVSSKTLESYLQAMHIKANVLKR